MKRFVANIKPYFLRLTSRNAEVLGKILIKKSLTISTAESCTGGLLSSRLTDISGSSAYILANFVTYSYDFKKEILGVTQETLNNFGAVSEQCAFEMVKGLQAKTKTDIAVATTGIAGPNSEGNKPVGLIFVGIYFKGEIEIIKFELSPLIYRKNMKFMFTEKVLELLIKKFVD